MRRQWISRYRREHLGGRAAAVLHPADRSGVVTESGQLLAGYLGARHPQPLDLPPRLAKDLASYLCLVQGELAERQIRTARGPEPDHYDEMDDAQLATRARALRIGILTLPADHPRRQYIVSERYVQRVSFDIRQSA